MQDEEKNQADAETSANGVTTSAESPAEQPRNPNMKWYIIHSYSGFEAVRSTPWTACSIRDMCSSRWIWMITCGT